MTVTASDNMVPAGLVSTWQSVTDGRRWDQALADLNGHPLQSWLWGEARRRVDGINFDGLACIDTAGTVVALARVEARRAGMLGKVAWIPKGPVHAPAMPLPPGLDDCLRDSGYCLWACSPWQEAPPEPTVPGAPQTIWLDLTSGREALLEGLDATCRYGIRRALRDGVVVEQTTDAAGIAAFHTICTAISARKHFALSGNNALMRELLDLSIADAPVTAHLFVARKGAVVVGGAFVLRAGSNLHYLWGGVDRDQAKSRASEALQWAVIEWGLAQGCTRYDLEGIDPVNNPGTYEFKKKLGGREIRLQPQREAALDWRGELVLRSLRLKRWLDARKAPAPDQEA